MLHPASLLLSWIAFAFVLQWVTASILTGVALLCLFMGLSFATQRSRRLLWGARWLLMSLTILFLFATPGEYLPGFAGSLLGLTFEGLERAGEQVSRLLAMLLSLALLHERVGTNGLVAGLYWLSGPFAWRKATAVRLMLVLELVEDKRQLRWREWLLPEVTDISADEKFSLAMPPLCLRDFLLMGCLLVAGLGVVTWL
jgi:hypothetical protein